MSDSRPIVSKRPLILPSFAVVFAMAMAAFAGSKLDARKLGTSPESMASLRRDVASETDVGARRGEYDISPAAFVPSSVDNNGTSYLLGGIRTVAIKSAASGSLPTHLEGQFLLAAPGSFIEFHMAGDKNGHYVLKISEKVIAIYFAVMNEERIEISFLKLKQGISGMLLELGADKGCAVSSASWSVDIPGCSQVTGVSSYSTNLLPDEILTLNYPSGAKL